MSEARDNLYLQLLGVFAPLSLLSFGGGQSILADIHTQAVEVHHWITSTQFVDLFAISRAAPGPGALFSTLIGWHVGGWGGAIAASIGLFAPSSILAYIIARAWNRNRDKAWFQQAQRALAPLASGLMLSSVLAILRSATGAASVWIIAAVATFLFSRFDKINPLPLLFAGGVAQALVQQWA